MLLIGIYKTLDNIVFLLDKKQLINRWLIIVLQLYALNKNILELAVFNCCVEN